MAPTAKAFDAVFVAPRNNSCTTGSESTAIPTAQGIVTSIVILKDWLNTFSAPRLSPFVYSAEIVGISAVPTAEAIDTGRFIRTVYCPEKIPYIFAE